MTNSERFIRVYGTPAPQGSKAARGRTRSGRVILVEQSELVKPWREAVKWAWLASRQPITLGPVHIDVAFFFDRPAKPKHDWPVVKDLDKLLRSTFDALTEAGAIEDDRFVVSVEAHKLFCSREQRGGANIQITAMAKESL